MDKMTGMIFAVVAFALAFIIIIAITSDVLVLGNVTANIHCITYCALKIVTPFASSVAPGGFCGC